MAGDLGGSGGVGVSVIRARKSKAMRELRMFAS
jgi:hypothetical protein